MQRSHTGASPAALIEALDWLAAVTARHPMHVARVPFEALDDWRFEPRPLRLAHRSGKFFTIEGIRTTTDHGPVRDWDQPIINQPEIGILGLLTKVIDGVRCGLMQAKLEPGNVNGAQLSPTLQATRSNYTRVHRGRRPTYLEYFTGEAPARVLIDQLQSEQASRFLHKRNRNLVVEPLDDPAVDDRFRWIPLAQVKSLLQYDNVVNMDTRSVLSCMPLALCAASEPGACPSSFGLELLGSLDARAPRHTTAEILDWIASLRARHDRTVVRRGLDVLRRWVVTPTEIAREDRRYFSVIGAQIETNGREVTRWSQPLLSHHGQGLNGLIAQRIGGVLHFLIRACLYPGSREIFELGSTASRSDYLSEAGPSAPPFLDLFASPPPGTVRFSSVQSEEGGRFFHYQNRYLILQLPPDTIRDLPEPFIWMTLGQIETLVPRGYFNIELRNLLACLHVT